MDYNATILRHFILEHEASGCWEWTGEKFATGYPRIRVDNVDLRAHRVVWSLLVGPIPKHRHLHHKCFNKVCVNPSHLEPVTPKEHAKRHGVTGICKANAEKHFCSAGHKFSEENTYKRPDGGRECKMCRDAKMQAYYLAHKDNWGKRRWADVACTDCGTEWRKRTDSLAGWSGLCKSCSMRRCKGARTVDP